MSQEQSPSTPANWRSRNAPAFANRSPASAAARSAPSCRTSTGSSSPCYRCCWWAASTPTATPAPRCSGAPGFARSPEPTRLRIDNLPQADDPLAANLEAGTRLGILGLEWPTRRRNRMNGRVLARDGKGFTVGVEQSFGNCPKYIQARSHQPVSRIASPALQGEGLDPRWLSLVSRSDTLFIASQHADPLRGGVDVSHRGGPPGFLRLGADGRLWLPDYAGNRLFNTLGNLLQDPRCGLLFIDFDNGDLLHLHAEAELFWPGSQPSIPWPAGAERLLALRPAGWRWRRGRLPLAFGEPQPSPFLPPGES